MASQLLQQNNYYQVYANRFYGDSQASAFAFAEQSSNTNITDGSPSVTFSWDVGSFQGQNIVIDADNTKINILKGGLYRFSYVINSEFQSGSDPFSLGAFLTLDGVSVMGGSENVQTMYNLSPSTVLDQKCFSDGGLMFVRDNGGVVQLKMNVANAVGAFNSLLSSARITINLVGFISS